MGTRKEDGRTPAQDTRPLRPVDPHAPQVLQVSINTDDPLTFATSLADEYAYAWAGMVVGADVAPNYARAWLDDAAAAGWASRFTFRTTPQKTNPNPVGVART